MVKKLSYYLPALVTAAIILFFGVLPGKSVDAVGLGKESFHINGHFFFFSLLCFFLYKPFKSILMSLVVTVLYGVAIELIQVYVPGRACSLFDVFTDTMGALISVLILWKLQPYLPKKLKNWLKQ
jgi:VanZ family protein